MTISVRYSRRRYRDGTLLERSGLDRDGMILVALASDGTITGRYSSLGWWHALEAELRFSIYQIKVPKATVPQALSLYGSCISGAGHSTVFSYQAWYEAPYSDQPKPKFDRFLNLAFVVRDTVLIYSYQAWQRELCPNHRTKFIRLLDFIFLV